MLKGIKIIYITAALIAFSPALLPAAGISVSGRIGYSPAVGGAMSSQWQADNMSSPDGINTINRSQPGTELSTIEVPTGIIAGAAYRIAGDAVYFKCGIEGVYSMFGGSGKTLDPSATEIVEVSYSQWSVDLPLTIGMSLLFWGESRVYAGCGIAFAYGTFSTSFKSASIDYSASFKGYAMPLIAEIGCEYMVTDKFSVGCEIVYFSGESSPVKKGADSARIDFSGFHFTAGAAWHFNF